MSIPLTINSQVFNYPQNFDESWGIDATGWAQAVTSGALYLSGGSFPLTAQVDFGGSFGIKVLNLLSETANVATGGYVRLAKTDAIEWRNNANSANLALAVNGSDALTFNGSVLGLTSLTNGDIYVGNASNVPIAVAMSGDATLTNTGVLTISNGAITDAKVASGAGIAGNKLAVLTGLRAMVTNSGGFMAASVTTASELSFVNGVTSPIQTQLNAIQQVPSGAMLDFAGTAAPTGWLLCDGSSYSTSTYPNLFAAIGYVWGGGGASFSVPNMTRRVGMGSGGSGTGTIGNAVGNTGGAEAITLTTAQVPSGTYSASSVVTDPGHSHIETAANAGGGTAVSVAQFNFSTTPPLFVNLTNSTASATTGITVATTVSDGNGGGSHSNIQPAAIVLKIIKI